MSRKDGGPAFPPNGGWTEDRRPHEGMNLRDYAAIHADIPWNAVIDTLRLLGELNPTMSRMVEYRAGLAYLQADAMLAARGE